MESAGEIGWAIHPRSFSQQEPYMSSFQSDLETRLNAAAALVSEKSLLELIELIWRNDRFFTSPAYNATAQLAAAKMREWNLQSEICNLPADGKTLLGDWKMP